MSTGTMLPARCGMPGCHNPVEDPGSNAIVIDLDEAKSISIPCCTRCRARHNAPADFNFYGMN